MVISRETIPGRGTTPTSLLGTIPPLLPNGCCDSFVNRLVLPYLINRNIERLGDETYAGRHDRGGW